MLEFPDLQTLTVLVDVQTKDFTALERLTAAEDMAENLSGLGDRLIGYYVERARAEGHSWSAIGAHLGVSRQAAQQRYTPRQSSLSLADLISSGAFTRLTPRTKDALARVDEHARRLGHDSVGSAHLLLALLDDTKTIAIKALDVLKVDRARVRAAVEAELPPGAEKSPAVIPVNPEGRRVLTATLAEALGMEHNYIGTEHILLGLLTDPQSVAGRALSGQAVTLDAGRTAVRDLLTEFLRSKG